MAEFFYRCGPNEYGPLTSAELRRLAHSGRVGAADEIRQGRTGRWVLAENVPGLFPRALPRRDLAINEMDVVAEILPETPLDRGVDSIAESDTVVASDADSGEVSAHRHPAHAPHAPHSPAERSDAAVVRRALAVVGLCYAAAALGLAFVVLMIVLWEPSPLHGTFAGVCFLISLAGLAGGRTIKRLIGLRGGPYHSQPG